MGLKHFYQPTPKKWRKIGDAILATGVFVASGGLLAFDKLEKIFSAHELKVIIGIALILGALGKFMTNFFSESDTKQQS